MPGLSMSGSSSRASSSQRADARTTARTSNRGGSARVTVQGDTSGVPSWLLVVGGLVFVLVVLAIIF